MGVKQVDNNNNLIVACIQMNIIFGDNKKNLEQSITLIDEACKSDASLIVLPELCISGYAFSDREEAFSLAEDISGGESETIKVWTSIANKQNVYIAGGILERDKEDLYNTSVLIGPDGLIGKYRKLHLWDEENLWFEKGDMGLKVFHTKLGRIGLMTGYDMWFPECYRILSMLDADIILIPSNIISHDCLPDDMKSFASVLNQAAAHSNRVYIACADRVGVERGISFAGKSNIIRSSGIVISSANDGSQQIIYGKCDLSRARKHQSNLYNSTKNDRRTDVYDRMLGYK